MKLSFKGGQLKIEPETPGEGFALGMLVGSSADVPFSIGPDDEYILVPIKFDEPTASTPAPRPGGGEE